MEFHNAYFILGSNEGDRIAILTEALNSIQIHIGKIQKRSSLYETASWGREDLPDHLNMVVLVCTGLTPFEILKKIHIIEASQGRIREGQWGLRTLDIDLIFYDQLVIKESDLQVPHPRMHMRRFTLIPMVEIEAQFIHPVLNKTMDRLLEECEDQLPVKIYEQKNL